MRAFGLWATALTLLLCLPARAEFVRILDDDCDAWSARLSLIQSAEQTLHAAFFSAANDEMTHVVLAACRDAARRGVKVRLLIDSLGNHIPRDMQLHLLDEGIEIRVFHPFCIANTFSVASRMHNKLLLRDGVELITGGRNMGAQYFGVGKKHHYRDRDVLVLGATAGEADRYFQFLWDGKHVRPIAGPFLWEKWNSHTACLAKASRQLDDAAVILAKEKHIEPCATPRTDFEICDGTIHFLHSKWIGSTSNGGIAKEILALFRSAKEEIIVESPYVQLSSDFRRAVKDAVQRGVKIRIVTNSIDSIDSMIAYAGYANQKRLLRRLGVELHEYCGPECLHAKTLVVDSHVVVGSYNLNGRSERLDTEVAICVQDQALAKELKASVERHMTCDDTQALERVPHPLTSILRVVSLIGLRPTAFLFKSHL